MTIQRKKPLRRTQNRSGHTRRWACACGWKNLGRTCEKCRGRKGTGRKSLSARCDSMWAQIVKAGGKCAVPGAIIFFDGPTPPRMFVGTVQCAGALEAAHVVPRRHRSVRWDPQNGRALCHAHHRFFTDNEREWRLFIGPEWDRLWVKAQERWDKSFPVASLSAQLQQVKQKEAA